MRRPNHRTILVLTLALLTGCAAIQRAMRAQDPKTWEPTKQLVNDGRLPEAVASLKQLGAELDPAVREKYSYTRYGSLVDEVVSKAALEPMANADKLAKQGPLTDAAEADRAALAGIDLVIELPLDALQKDKASRKALTEARAAIEKRMTERAGKAATQVRIAREDEAAGRIALALYEWSRIVPLTADIAKEREEKLLSLAKALFVASGARVSLEAAKGAPAGLADALRNGQRRAQARMQTLSFAGAAEADVAITVSAGQPTTKRASQNVTLQWKYPSGKREVANPDYAKLQEKIAKLEKEAAWQKGKYDNTNCGRGGSVRGRTKAPGGDCAKAYYQAWQKYSKDAEAARKSLSRTKPRKIETVYSLHSYEAREDSVVLEQPVEAELRFKDGRVERPKGAAKVTVKAYTHAGHAPVKLAPRAEKLPADAKLEEMLRADLALRVVDTLELAQKGMAAQLEKERAKATDEAVQTELQLRKAARVGFDSIGWNPVEKFVEARLGQPLAPAPKYAVLYKAGQEGTLWDRLVAFAAEEEQAGRLASALAGWSGAPAFDEAHRKERAEKLEALGARVREELLVAFEAKAGSSAQAPGVAAKLADAFVALAGYRRAEGPARLVVALDAPAPKIERSSGEVDLEQELVTGEEEVDNPDYVERVAQISAAEEKGDFASAQIGRMFLDAVKPTLMQKIVETHPYKAKRAQAVLEAEVTAKVSFGGRAESLTVPVRFVKEAFQHPARAATKLEARSETLPDDAALRAEWEAAAALAVRDAVGEWLHTPESDGGGPVINAAILRTARLRTTDWIDLAAYSNVIRERLGINDVGPVNDLLKEGGRGRAPGAR